MIMSNRSIYDLIERLAKLPSYDKCLKISERKSDEQYSLEMIVRLLVADHMNWEDISKYKELSELLDKEILKICDDSKYNAEGISKRFENTFDLLSGVFGEDAFRKYDGEKYTGPFLASSFQTIACGVMTNINSIISLTNRNQWLVNKVKQMYGEEVYVRNTVPGVRAIPRYKELSIWGREYFAL